MVSKLIAHDEVIMKIVLLIYIMLISNVTFPCFSSNLLDDSSRVFIITFDGAFVAFPPSDPRFDCRISSPCRMSALIIRQSSNSYFLHRQCNL